MKQNAIIFTIVVAIVVAGLGFYAGMKYGQQSRRNSFAQFGGGQGGFLRGGSGANGMGNKQGFRPVTGQVISSDAQSITVKLLDGSSRIILISNSTQINQATKATKDDLKTGSEVAVFGTENSDGSITAQNVQLNPQLEMRRGMQASPAATQ